MVDVDNKSSPIWQLEKRNDIIKKWLTKMYISLFRIHHINYHLRIQLKNDLIM